MPNPYDGGELRNAQLKLFDGTDRLPEFFEWFNRPRTALAIDTETSGLKNHKHHLRLIQIGDDDEGWVIPCDRWGGLAEEVIDKWQGDWVLHHSKFDVNFLRRHGFLRSPWPWHRTHDTMALAHVFDPMRPKGLKNLGARLVDPSASFMQVALDNEMRKNGWTWGTVPLSCEPYWWYAALDPIITSRVFNKLMPRLDDSSRQAYELELGANIVIANMEYRGAHIDYDYCQATAARLKNYAQQVRTWCLENFGLKNPGSSMQLLDTFRGMGAVVSVFTDGGDDSASKYQLRLWQRDQDPRIRELASAVLGMRAAEKRVDSYLMNFMEDADGDSCVHAAIWPGGTKTARMSISDPALQTLPRGDAIVRDAFDSRYGDQGRVITCDYAQIEARLMAHFSQDEGLRAAFMSDQDFFVALAHDIYQDPTLTKASPLRQLVKNTVYGKCYAAGVQKMAETAGVPYEEMEPVSKAFDARYPGVKIFQRMIDQTAQRRLAEEGVGYIITPYGRKLNADPEKLYTLINYTIQAHAAEILKRKLTEMSQVGLDPYLVLPVHDEVILDVPVQDAEDVRQLLMNTMQDLDNYFVPLPVETAVLNRWGDKYHGEGT